MFNKFYRNLKVTKDLSFGGKLHKKLLFRLLMMLAMVVITFSLVIYDIAIYRINFFISFITIVLTFYLGYYMSKASKISWDEEQKLIVAVKMDLTGGLVLVIYIVARLISGRLLDSIFQDAVVIFTITMSIMAGLALGKFSGFLSQVRKAYAQNKK